MAGRKGKYNKAIHNKMIECIRKGYTYLETAKSCGIAEVTLYEWLKESSNVYKPQLAKDFKKAQEVLDFKVEQKLFKRSMGYKHKEVIKELVRNEDGTQELRVTKIIEKERAPEVGAMVFWLKNRQPDRWRDKRDYTMKLDELEKDKSLIEGLLGDNKEAE